MTTERIGEAQGGFTFAAPHDPVIGTSAGVTFMEMTAKSVVNRVRGTRLSDFFSVNPYRGCEHACAYCYARYTHEFLDRRPGEEFQRRVYVKVNAPEAFLKDLRRTRDIGRQQILFGSATDPYQPAEARFTLTRRMLEQLLPLKGLSVGIVTKSPLVERDVDILAELARRHDLEVLVSCAFSETKLQRSLEPRVVSPDRRMQAIARLSQAGIPTGLLCAPVIPGVNDGHEALVKLFRTAREAGASSAFGQTLFLSKATREPFFQWLRANRPDLVDAYGRGYREGLELRPDWKEVVDERLWAARREVGFGGTPDRHGRDGPGPREVMSVEEVSQEPSST